MALNLKTAAEELLKMADAIEKVAFEKTFFVCNKCNHTASLATINSKRKVAAEQHGVKKVRNVGVDDKIACPACDGLMSYVATEDSSPYFTDQPEQFGDQNPPEDKTPPEEEQKPPLPKKPTDVPPEEGTPEGEPSADDIFEPVDEQGKEDIDLSYGDEGEEGSPEGEGALPAPEKAEAPEGEEVPAPAGDVPPPPAFGADKTLPPPVAPGAKPPVPGMGKEPPMPPPTEEGAPEEGAPEEGAPEEAPEGTPEEGVPEEAPEETPEEGEPGEDVSPEEQDVTTEQEGPLMPPKKKKKVPKFEKMPDDSGKEAGDQFLAAAIQRYSQFE